MKKNRKQPIKLTAKKQCLLERKTLRRSGPSKCIRTSGVYTPFYDKSQQITDRRNVSQQNKANLKQVHG